MPTTIEVEQALQALRVAQAAYEEAVARRRDAIVEASHAGIALREIADAVKNDVSHEVIRGIVGPRAGVAFEWDDEIFQLSEPQTRALVYKADGYGRGAFPSDVAKLDAGEEWLGFASNLARAIRRVHVGLDTGPIRLDRDHGFALYQILRLTYMTALSRVADLRGRLQAHFGTPPPIARGRR